MRSKQIYQWGNLRRGGRICLEIKREDLWVGAFYKRGTMLGGQLDSLDIWICLLPCLPLHITLVKHWREP